MARLAPDFRVGSRLVEWDEVFVVFLVCHLVGDYLFQTDWQARNKRGGLGADPTARRALLSHVSSYTIAFVPVFVALWDSLGAGVLGIAGLVFLPHLIQDDGRLVSAWLERVKRCDPADVIRLFTPVDQSFHMLVLLLVAFAAGS
jgi:hypothetical protein